jgi:hypothetical protein
VVVVTGIENGFTWRHYRARLGAIHRGLISGGPFPGPQRAEGM